MAVDTLDASAPGGRRPARTEYWWDIVFGRTLPALFFSIFLVDKFLQVRDAVSATPARAQPSDYLDPLDQVLALAYFALLVVLYITRLPKRAGDGRPGIIVVSFFGSFAVLLGGVLPREAPQTYLLLPSALLISAGLAYSVWSLVYLRRSFSIIPEARQLVTGGPYSLSRHPLYLGEGAAALGLLMIGAGWASALLMVLLLVCQYIRILAEERVLSGEFPEYAAYARRVPRYLPDLRRLLPLR